MSNLDAEDKLIKARVHLFVSSPFYGRLAMRLKPVESTHPNLQTTATDGRHLFWDRKWVDKCTDSDLTFCIEHEIWHCIQKAFGRAPQGCHPGLWNLACDYVINTIILDSGKYKDSKVLEEVCTSKVQGMARDKVTEEVYRDIMKDAPKCKACELGQPFPMPGDQQGQDSPGQQEGGEQEGGEQEGQEEDGKGKGNKSNKGGGKGGKKVEHTCHGGCISTILSGDMDKSTKSKWKQYVISAAQYAHTRGDLPGELENMLGEFLNPSVSWKDLIRTRATKAFRGRYTWRRLSRRQGEVPLRMISRDKNGRGAVIMLDTSGSISDKELQQFVSEAAEILRVCNARYVDIYMHDTHCYKKWRFGSKENSNWEVRRGGTSHVDVFEKVKEAEEPVGLVIAFTDLETCFPSEAPSYPVIWGHPKNHGENIQVPFGNKVEVELNDQYT